MPMMHLKEWLKPWQRLKWPFLEKHLIKEAYGEVIPDSIINRRDKMGFPVPLKEWVAGELREFVNDTFSGTRAQTRPFMNAQALRNRRDNAGQFSRKLWGLLSLELWYQNFHDRADFYKRLLEPGDIAATVQPA